MHPSRFTFHLLISLFLYFLCSLWIAGCRGHRRPIISSPVDTVSPPGNAGISTIVDEDAGIDAKDDDAARFRKANTHCHPGASIETLQFIVKEYQLLEHHAISGESSVNVCEIYWRLASAMFFASEIVGLPSEKLRWIDDGEAVADKLIAACSDRVEGYYYAAVLKGRRAEVSGNGFKALRLVKEVLALGNRAAAIDETFDNAAPLRLLAMLYAKAPSWPASVGDIDLALETAEKALSISDYPMNHLIMAEVLIEDSDFERAREELKMVLKAEMTGVWAREGLRWRPYAESLLSEIANK